MCSLCLRVLIWVKVIVFTAPFVNALCKNLNTPVGGSVSASPFRLRLSCNISALDRRAGLPALAIDLPKILEARDYLQIQGTGLKRSPEGAMGQN